MIREREYQHFLTLMLILQTIFDRDAVSEQKLELYYEYLSDLSLVEMKRGVDAIVSTRRYTSFPTVAEIREAALGITDDRVESAALDAWHRANIALIAGRPVDDPALNEAVRLAFGGWGGFGQAEPNNEFVKKRFVECYRTAASKRRETNTLVDGRSIIRTLPK